MRIHGRYAHARDILNLIVSYIARTRDAWHLAIALRREGEYNNSRFNKIT